MRARPGPLLPATLLSAALLGGGCGGGSTAGALRPADAGTLHQDVSSIRAAAATNHPGIAHAEVAVLRGHLEQMVRTKRLSSLDARVLIVEATHADGRISAEVHRVVPNPPATNAPGAVAVAPAGGPAAGLSPQGQAPVGPHPGNQGPGNVNAHGKDRGPGHGKGKGHGHGGD